MSIAGTALAVVLSLPLALLAAPNTAPHPVVYQAARIVLAALRSVPEIIMGILFVAAVGFGALPGVLALALHSVGMVGKFYAEAIEHVDPKPLEAARAAGATPLQVITHAVLPQVLPQLADITIYRWEYHFRASAVLGIVGAGGIGFELIAALRIIDYDQVSAILLSILACVDRGRRRRRASAQGAEMKCDHAFSSPTGCMSRRCARLSSLGDVDANDTRTPWPRDEVMRRAEKADAILAFMTDRIDAPFLARCKRLRVVACALKGYDNFDMQACNEAGVAVSIVPDLLTEPTAELAVGLAIGLARNIREGDASVRSGAFEGWRPVMYGTGLDGSVVSIIGMGRVGRAVAQRLSGFGCRILGIDAEAVMPAGVTSESLDIALETSDFIILCAPLTPGSHHLIGADALGRMKTGALLVNIGRGSVVE